MQKPRSKLVQASSFAGCFRRRLLDVVTPALLLAVSACAGPSPQHLASDGAAEMPKVEISSDSQYATATISVLTYNIEGLGWPARSNREQQLAEIARRLAAMRRAGTAPDVVMFQEMFSSAAKAAVGATGYPAIVSGPNRTTEPDEKLEAMPGMRRIHHGEIGLHLAGSGLAIASRYPVSFVGRRAFGNHACAGLDCLANKGIVLARISVPGVPVPIDIYDTHLNSQRSAHVKAERSLIAHNRQDMEAFQFVDTTRGDTSPVIFGGDFNMKRSDKRWEDFSQYGNLSLVHRVCADRDALCEVRLSWDGDTPWKDTEDLQLFANGETVSIRPIRVEAMFDGGASGPRLSDHDGFLVTYELRWPVAVKTAQAN
jgi:endonuclease/exonuclease/phosphatase family metal-dependent hydrolase